MMDGIIQRNYRIRAAACPFFFFFRLYLPHLNQLLRKRRT
jgi:hypothetical protein